MFQATVEKLCPNLLNFVLSVCSGVQPRRGEQVDSSLHGPMAPAGERLPAGQQAALCRGSPPSGQSQPQDSPAR